MAAVFIVRANTSLRFLRARLIASKLALPAHSRFLAILTADRYLPADVVDAFDEISRERGRARLLRAASADKPDTTRYSDLKEISRVNDRRYTAIMQLLHLRGRRAIPPRTPPSVSRELVRRAGDRPTIAFDPRQKTESSSNRVEQELNNAHIRRVAFVNGSVVTTLPGTMRNSYRQRLGAIWSSGLLGSYELDRGTPYPTNVGPHVVLSDRHIPYSPDPLKPMRAAAFAGWALISAKSADEVEEFVERLRHAHEKRMHEWS